MWSHVQSSSPVIQSCWWIKMNDVVTPFPAADESCDRCYITLLFTSWWWEEDCVISHHMYHLIDHIILPAEQSSSGECYLSHISWVKWCVWSHNFTSFRGEWSDLMWVTNHSSQQMMWPIHLRSFAEWWDVIWSFTWLSDGMWCGSILFTCSEIKLSHHISHAVWCYISPPHQVTNIGAVRSISRQQVESISRMQVKMNLIKLKRIGSWGPRCRGPYTLWGYPNTSLLAPLCPIIPRNMPHNPLFWANYRVNRPK